MTIWEKIYDSMIDPPAMPPRAGSGDIECGIAVIAKVIADEKEREEKERREAEEAWRKAKESASREENPSVRHHTRMSADDLRRMEISPRGREPDVMCKSDHSSVQVVGGGLGNDWLHKEIFPIKPRRPKPKLHARVLSFSARLITYVKAYCGGVAKTAYYRSGVSRQVYSRITCYDDSQADKLTVMKFCIGLQLGRSDADLLMKSAGYAFSDTIPVDRAFTYAIENKMWNINDVNAMLVRNSLPSLNLQF